MTLRFSNYLYNVCIVKDRCVFDLDTTSRDSVLPTCINEQDNGMTDQKQTNENRTIESQYAMNTKSTGLIN
jgi:hypothetical protein